MFFLGMSAHLFIYLLVPAFLIVCFYFRGAAGSPEVDPILPEAVVYQQTGTSSFEKAYFYQVEKQEQKTYSKAEVFCDCKPDLPLFQSVFYLSPALTHLLLRAPTATV